MLANAQAELRIRAELEALQLERFRKVLTWAYDKSAFYRRSFRAWGVEPDDVKSLADVGKLPFVTADDLRGSELDFLTLPLSSVARVGYCNGFECFQTLGDVRDNVEMMIRAFAAANVLRGSTVRLFGEPADGRLFDALYALESLGATVVLSGTGFHVDVVLNASELPEPPFYRCEAGNLHVQEDFFLPEVLSGELVITTLTAQALPLIRFKTGRRVRLIDAPCPCGRTFKRTAE